MEEKQTLLDFTEINFSEALHEVQIAQNQLDMASNSDFIDVAIFRLSAAEMRLRSVISLARAEFSEDNNEESFWLQ